MTILLMGFRSGAAKAIEKMNLEYMIWSEKKLLNKRQCLKTIITDFPQNQEDIQQFLDDFSSITHVIASTESAVIPASKIRKWLDLNRNKDSVIIRCTDKLEMKKYLSKKNIPMTKFLPTRGMKAVEIISELGLPVVNKVRLSSGGRGVEFLDTLHEVEDSMSADSYFEKPLNGTEGSIESFIIDGKIHFSNITQYYKNGACNILPGQYADIINKKIKVLNEDVIKALRVKWGMTHLEYYILDNGEVLFGEVALRPPGGYIMEALERAYGVSFWKLFIQVELNLDDLEFKVLNENSCSIIIHPGEGIVTDIKGVDEVKSLKSMKKIKLNLKVGDKTLSREGVGVDHGYAILANSNPKILLSDVDKFYDLLKITIC